MSQTVQKKTGTGESAARESGTSSLDRITLGVPNVQTARGFYTSVFSSTAFDRGPKVTLDMHRTGEVTLCKLHALAEDVGAHPTTSGFRGYTLNVIVRQPSQVKALLDAAVQGGAKVLKPAKKSLFAGFSAVFEAPDGAIWKVATSSRKEISPAETPPIPTECVVILGVADPKASKGFYSALDMTIDRDYGSKYVDFRFTPGTFRLGLMPRQLLAKDAGVRANGAGFPGAVLTRKLQSREEVDALLAEAVSHGGRIAATARETGSGTYTGHFTDPDGFLWQATTGPSASIS